MSGFVWNLHISGNENISSESILESLEALNIKEGVRISKIDPQIARNQLLINRKDVAWAAFNIEGCRLTVDITETKQKDDKSKDPSNIKALEDGVIKSVEVISGVANVRVGDAVLKGDLLVSGAKEYKDGHTEFLRSRAKIIAETEKVIRVEIPFKQIKKLQTGKYKKRRTLCFFGVKVPLYLGPVGENFELEPSPETENTSKPYLPIKIIENSYYETYETEILLSDDKAKQQAKTELEKQIKNYLSGGKILSQRIVSETNKNSQVMYAEVKCEKDIILEEKILVNTRN
jgi:similar to stage IV sporulation protein